MRRVRRNHDNASGIHLAPFAADRDSGTAFERERDLDVRMRVQWRTLARLRVDDISRERRAFFFAGELIRHSDKGQLLK